MVRLARFTFLAAALLGCDGPTTGDDAGLDGTVEDNFGVVEDHVCGGPCVHDGRP